MTTYKVWNGSAWVHIDNQNYDARYVLASSKGSNDGVASLDESGHIPSEQLPSSITGAVSYKGTFDPTEGAPIPAAQGYYYVASAVGSVSETSFSTGDWLVYVDESTWNKIENSSSSVTWSNVTDRPASYAPDSHGNESHSELYITTTDITYEALDTNGDVGTGATQVAAGNHAHTGTYQPLDADLTAIGGLSGTSGLLKKTAANTWTLDTNTYLTESSTVNNALMWDSNEFPSDGLALQVLRLNSGGTSLEFATVTGGSSSSFLDLTDTPETYSGYDNTYYVRVNEAGNALEFATVSGSGGAVDSVNGQTGVVVLSASDVSAVPTTRTVNSKALSADITLSANDVSAVPVTRTVNSKALSSDISLTYTDVGAAASDHAHSGVYQPADSELTLLAALSLSGNNSKYIRLNSAGDAFEFATVASSYELPTASADTLGGVKVGSGLSITDGVLSATGGSGGASALVQRSLEGVVYETTLMYWRAPAACTIDSCSMSLSSNPSATGSYCKVQVMKNGTLETNSIFSADTPMQVTELTSASNGVYTGTGTLDSGQTTLASGDVIQFRVNQADTGSADLLVQMMVTFT